MSQVNFIFLVLIIWHARKAHRSKVHYRLDPCQPLWYVVQIFFCRMYGRRAFFLEEIHINCLISAFQLAPWFLSTIHLNLVSYKEECLSAFPATFYFFSHFWSSDTGYCILSANVDWSCPWKDVHLTCQGVSDWQQI